LRARDISVLIAWRDSGRRVRIQNVLFVIKFGKPFPRAKSAFPGYNSPLPRSSGKAGGKRGLKNEIRQRDFNHKTQKIHD